MIADMRKMAEAFLLLPPKRDSEDDLSPDQRRVEFLCEPHEAGTPVYVLFPGEKGVAFLRRQEMQSGQSWRAPWIKPGGPNSAYLVPVIKVDREKGGAESKRKRTVTHFKALASSRDPAAPYFGAVLDVLESTRFLRQGHDGVGREVPDAYGAAIGEIVRDAPKQKSGTPLLVVAIDRDGETWPGDDPRLVRWLLDAEHRLSIYGKSESPGVSCALCSGPGPLYPNALPGSGLNFVNGAFRGSFPEMRDGNAWKRFAICPKCADLLFVYKNHVAPAFIEPVVGSNALIIPSADLAGTTAAFAKFIKAVREMMDRSDRTAGERRVLQHLSAEASVATLSLLWAENFGQKIDGIRGFVTHVLPTRLAELNTVNEAYNLPREPGTGPPRSPLYPVDLRDGVRRRIDLTLGLAEELLRRPGGQKVKSENQSPRRRALLYELAACVFHRERRLTPGPLWQEIDQTARAYCTMLLEQNDAGVLYQCSQEGPRDHPSGKWIPLTVNGWARHLYLFLVYLSDERVNALPQETTVYEATQDSLKPLLSQARGLDTDAKAFTFLLGILYGHLIYVQARKAQVNVAANALSWMRGGRLRAADLHELYGKIAAKLCEYDALEVGRYRKWKEIHELETEIGRLGVRVQVPVRAEELPDEQVLYFLMLGIALSYTFTTSGRPKDQGANE